MPIQYTSPWTIGILEKEALIKSLNQAGIRAYLTHDYKPDVAIPVGDKDYLVTIKDITPNYPAGGGATSQSN